MNAPTQINVNSIGAVADLSPALLDAWRGLLLESKLNPTLDPGWLDVAHRTIGASAPLFVCEWHVDGNLKAILPFERQRTAMSGVPVRLLRPASNIFSYHADLAGDDPASRLLEWLRHEGDWDVLHVCNVDLDGRMDRALRQVAEQTGARVLVIPGEQSPYLRIETGWEPFLATKHKKFRYGVRHRRELILKAGGELRWLNEPAQVQTLLDDILAIDKQSWKAQIGRDIAASPMELSYHRALLTYLAERNALLANVLYLENQPAAYCLCANVDGWVGNMKTSFVERFSQLSPGAFVIDECVQKAFEIKATEFDFLGDVGRHKLAWSSAVRPQAGFMLFAPTLKGRAAHLFKHLRSRWQARAEAKAKAKSKGSESSATDAAS